MPGGLERNAAVMYIRQIEQSTMQHIVDILEPILGPNNARVQVTADVDFSRSEAVAETFKPNQTPAAAAIRSQQMNQSTTTSAAAAQGVPGALSNQPPAGGTAPINGTPTTAATPPAGVPTSTRKDESTNYEVDKTIQHTRAPVGGIKRLTAAVAAFNNRRETDDKGKVTTRCHLKPQEIRADHRPYAVVAMGFNKERGDSLNILNTPFNAPDQEVIPDVPWWKQQENTPDGQGNR